MKEIILSLLLLFTIEVCAQNGFLSSSHTCQVEESTLTIYQVAEFTIGNGTVCDYYDTAIVTSIDNWITVDVYYDISGFELQLYCIDYDTIISAFPEGNYSLSVNAHIIYVDENNALDTLNIDSDTSSIVLSSIEEEDLNGICIYPNPTYSDINIENKGQAKIRRILLLNSIGQIVKSYTSDSDYIILPVANIPKGYYYLHITTDIGVLTEKLIIE